MRYLFSLLITFELYAITIIDRPITFDEQRVSLTKEYIKQRYHLEVNDIKITPRIIVIHWTAINSLEESISRFMKPTLPTDRFDIAQASTLNVSTHFMVDRDGTIYRLMDETTMARHIIGLNYSAIGIENVGGERNIDNLTASQLDANIKLITYLQQKYPSIEFLIGHHEYIGFIHHPLWLEKDRSYRTLKHDPGEPFMHKLRQRFPQLKHSDESHP